MDINYQLFKYEVPNNWYEGLYVDKTKPCNAGRSFSLLNDIRSDECWLLIHGFRGYPGELVRPAYDLYLAGYDVYVPRFPGMGTSGEDFVASNSADWLKLVNAAISDLKTKYKKVNLLGHSTGAALCGLALKTNEVAKVIYAAPSFENLEMTFFNRIRLAFLSIFTDKIEAPWKRTNLHHHYYEGAPADEEYLGNEYYKWYFTSKTLDYYRISRSGLKELAKHKHKHLVICPTKDKVISIPSTEQYRSLLKEEANIVEIEKGTHFVFYDIDIEPEENAVKAVLDFAKE